MGRLSLADNQSQVQGEDRKSYDRRIKDLELRLTSILSAKARDDEEHASRVKVGFSSPPKPSPAMLDGLEAKNVSDHLNERKATYSAVLLRF